MVIGQTVTTHSLNMHGSMVFTQEMKPILAVNGPGLARQGHSAQDKGRHHTQTCTSHSTCLARSLGQGTV